MAYELIENQKPSMGTVIVRRGVSVLILVKTVENVIFIEIQLMLMSEQMVQFLLLGVLIL